MNLRHLKYFVATAESGQVSRAAGALSISQSSVTSAIKELEQSLDTDLFQRTAHGMELTETGRQFLGSCKDILERVDEATKLTRRHTAFSGELSIAATYTVLGYFLPYHLGRLAELHPGLEITLYELNRESIEEGLLSHRFDIGMLLTSNLDNPHLDTETLLRSPRRLWVPSGHRFARNGKARFEEIAEEDYIMLTVDEAAHTTMRYWSTTNYTPRTKLRTSSVEAVRSLVANGQGVTILSDMVYRPWSLEGKRLETAATDVELPTMDVGLAWEKNTRFSPAMQVVHDYFRQSYMSTHLPRK